MRRPSESTRSCGGGMLCMKETSLEDSRIEYDVAGQMDQVYTMRDGVLQTGDQELGAA